MLFCYAAPIICVNSGATDVRAGSRKGCPCGPAGEQGYRVLVVRKGKVPPERVAAGSDGNHGRADVQGSGRVPVSKRFDDFYFCLSGGAGGGGQFKIYLHRQRTAAA